MKNKLFAAAQHLSVESSHEVLEIRILSENERFGVANVILKGGFDIACNIEIMIMIDYEPCRNVKILVCDPIMVTPHFLYKIHKIQDDFVCGIDFWFEQNKSHFNYVKRLEA